MALMEWRCTYQAFERDIQPAITNSPTHLLTNKISLYAFLSSFSFDISLLYNREIDGEIERKDV
jgi:hypothetical protein